MEKLDITRESAFDAFKAADSNGKQLLSNLFPGTFGDVRSRIKIFSDILRENNLSQDEYDQRIKNLPIDEVGYIDCKLIVSAYNQGEKPDFNNEKQRKYAPLFQMGSPSGAGFSYYDYDLWVTLSGVGSRLTYLDYDNMKDAVSKFLPHYQKYLNS